MLGLLDIGRIQQAFQEHQTYAGAAAATGLSRKTIAAVVQRGFTQPTLNRATSRAAATRRALMRRIAKKTSKKEHRKWPKFGSARQIRDELRRQTGEFVSIRTVQRGLLEEGLRSYVRRPQPTRRRSELEKKKEFARNHRNLSWRRVVFSDESWLCCNERTERTQYAESRDDVLPLERKARWNVPSIMVWGAIGYNYKSRLIIFPSKAENEDGDLRQFRLDAKGYVRKCLSTVAGDMVAGRKVWMQDGARSHAAGSTKAYLKRKGITWLEDWPPYSPELNAIERIWKELNARIGRRCPLTVEELIVCAQEEWERLDQALINRHCRHFGTQVRELANL